MSDAEIRGLCPPQFAPVWDAFEANFAAGEANVTGDPNAFDLYNLSQIQALHVGAPLIQRHPDGQFKLTIGIAKSADLNPPFLAFPFTAPGTTINPQGEIEFLFASPDDAAFFRLESR